MILETAVGRTRGCFDWCASQGATTLRATAREAKQRRMARQAQCHRVRSALTQTVSVIKGNNVSVHADFPKAKSGQLRFLGSMSQVICSDAMVFKGPGLDT